MTLKKLYTLLFFLGVFFFSFNEFEGIPLLGEFQGEAGAFFFLAGFGVLLLSGKISLPLKSPFFQLLLLFLLWCLITTLVNLPMVITSFYKHTTGINRFIRQYIALLLSAVVFFIFYWNVVKEMTAKDILLKIRKVLLWSLIVATVYGFLETMVVVFYIPQARPLLELFSYLPFLEVKLQVARISSIAYEPPSFGIYLITIAGWMFSYILTEKNIIKFLPMLLVVILTYFCGSRTALMVVGLQLVVFFSILYKSAEYKKYIAYISGFAALVVVLLLTVNASKVIRSVEAKIESLDFQDNLTNNISNQSRFGIQYASIQVFKQHPIAGVGYGQQTYYSRFYYPRWATKNNYEFKMFYKNPNEKAFPPGYNLVTRLLAETGIIGLCIFVFFLYVVLKRTRFLVKTTHNEERLLAIVLLITFTGLIINWLQIDSFRMYGFWLSLAILIRLSAPVKPLGNE